MPLTAADLRRTWLFGPGVGDAVHAAMAACGADLLILDLEDFTPEPLRPKARQGLAGVLATWSAAGAVTCVRINALDSADGTQDLAAAMAAGAQVIALPMADDPAQMQALDRALVEHERAWQRPVGTTEILPVCETARGVVRVRELAAASARVRAALLGTEDLAADLGAERGPDGVELEHARRRFLLDCRAAAIEPVDAPYTYGDADGAAREAAHARRLGYRAKALVRPRTCRADQRRADAVAGGLRARDGRRAGLRGGARRRSGAGAGGRPVGGGAHLPQRAAAAAARRAVASRAGRLSGGRRWATRRRPRDGSTAPSPGRHRAAGADVLCDGAPYPGRGQLSRRDGQKPARIPTDSDRPSRGTRSRSVATVLAW